MKRLKTNLGRRRVNARRNQQSHALNVRVRTRKITAQRVSKILFWSCMALLTLSVLGGGTYGVHRALNHFFWKNPNYLLTEIRFQSDGPLGKEEALKLCGIQLGTNIFSVDLAGIREKLSGLPRVTHVEIERNLPNCVSIQINERKPIAWIAEKNLEPGSEHCWLIDANGTLFKQSELQPDHLKLPVIHGLPGTELGEGIALTSLEVNAALRLAQLGDTIEQLEARSIDLSKGYCMQVTTSSHSVITFGFERLDEQLERLAKCLKYCDENKRDLQTVNLLVQRNVPVTFMAADEAPSQATPPAAASKKGAKPAKTEALESSKKKSRAPLEPLIRKAIPVTATSTHG